MLYQLIYSPFKGFMLCLVYWYHLLVKMLLKLNCVSGFNLYDIPFVGFVGIVVISRCVVYVYLG